MVAVMDFFIVLFKHSSRGIHMTQLCNLKQLHATQIDDKVQFYVEG